MLRKDFRCIKNRTSIKEWEVIKNCQLVPWYLEENIFIAHISTLLSSKDVVGCSQTFALRVGGKIKMNKFLPTGASVVFHGNIPLSFFFILEGCFMRPLFPRLPAYVGSVNDSGRCNERLVYVNCANNAFTRSSSFEILRGRVCATCAFCGIFTRWFAVERWCASFQSDLLFARVRARFLGIDFARGTVPRGSPAENCLVEVSIKQRDLLVWKARQSLFSFARIWFHWFENFEKRFSLGTCGF